MAKKKKCVIIFTEGETEIEFYDLLIEKIKKNKNIKKFNVDKIIKKTLKGISKFDKKLINKFRFDILPKYSDYDITIFLCYDTDVFEDCQKPVVNWQKVERELLNCGVKKVSHIKAEKCIEDIFLLDMQGICRYLNISPIKNITGINGVEKMKKIFLKGNRIYQKGYKCEGFIKHLDIDYILKKKKEMFGPLIDELIGVKEYEKN